MLTASVVTVAGLSACGGNVAVPRVASPDARPTVAAVRRSASAGAGHPSHPAATHRPGHRRHVPHGLPEIHDPGRVTGTLTGPCRTRDHGQLPDPACTPGAIDPAVTQANIGGTICRSGYTESVRPPESQTEAFKWGVAAPAYGQQNISGELDHLVPLELGGANDARNLWIEAGPIPNPKDSVENALNRAVCDGQMTLRAAQLAIARNWIRAAALVGVGLPAPGGQPSPTASASSPWCSASASYDSQYADWDVYVHSNQPDASVTASGGGYSRTWHTDASGYADVYLHGPARGQVIRVAAGAARCSTTAG